MKHANENRYAIRSLSSGVITSEAKISEYVDAASRLSGIAGDVIAMEAVTYLREAAYNLNEAAFLIASRMAPMSSLAVEAARNAATDMLEELQDLMDGVGPVEVSH